MLSFEDCFQWLNQFRPRIYAHKEMLDKPLDTSAWSGLSAPTQALKTSIQGLFDSNQKTQALKTMLMFEEIGGRALSSFERGETYAWCGWFYYKLPDDAQRNASFKRAAAEYPATSHQRAIAYLLLAFSEWEFSKNTEAILHFQKGMEELKALEIQSQQDHLDDRSAWYKNNIPEVEKTLASLLQSLAGVKK